MTRRASMAQPKAEVHAITREARAAMMTAPTAAVRATVAIRELNMVPIGLVNHQYFCGAQVFLLKIQPHVSSGLSHERFNGNVGRTCYSFSTAAKGPGVTGKCAQGGLHGF
jgi:hypothetical protein